MILKLTSILGLGVFLGICYALSTNRKAIVWKPVIGGCLLQLFFAVIILKTSAGQVVFESARVFFDALFAFSIDGAAFVFGPLVKTNLTGQAFGPGNAFIFAFQISATIIFVSSLMAILYHLNIMQKIVYVFAKVMQKLMGTSGSESLASAANVFMGQTESPLVVKPYLKHMTKSEIMAMMTAGMATVSGGVLAAFVSFGIDAGHLLAASVMSAPATLAIAKIMVPETQESETKGTVPKQSGETDVNLLDAACRGASEGLHLSLNVMGMLIAFIALISMVNYGLTSVSTLVTGTPITLEVLLGYIFSPFAFLMGVPEKDILQVGSLLGVKTTVNEFVAFMNLAQIKDTLEPRSQMIATYALCGFASFSSIAIQIGGIGALVPSRRSDLAKLGLRAMVGGTIASFMTATIAGMLI